MTLGSLFDGVGSWQIAATRNEIQPLWSSEIEKFPCAVTLKHFPETIQLGDVNKIDGGKIPAVDIICAGSPCQDLSIAGRREGLNGERSSLFFRAVDIIRQMRSETSGKYPTYFVWENVTGALNSNSGLDFKAVLEEIAETELPMPDSGKWANAGMVRIGKCEIAWRVLDAQYFGVPQRRKRIFLVADFTGNRATKILFEQEKLSRDTAQSDDERKRNSTGTENGVDDSSKLKLFENHGRDCRWKKLEKVSTTMTANFGTGGNNTPFVVKTALQARDYKGVGNQYFNEGKVQVTGDGVRRLTPLECERLQGLPDNYTLIDDKTCSDSARYKAIGNGMAQPVADWILSRLKSVTPTVKAGDILKFESSQYWFDRKYPEGRYIVSEQKKFKPYQVENGEWDSIETDETELRLNYKLKNGSYGVGLLEKYLDKNFKVIGNIFEGDE